MNNRTSWVARAYLLVQLDAFHHFETEREVTEVNVHTQKTDDAEVSEHAVKRALTIFTYNFAVARR